MATTEPFDDDDDEEAEGKRLRIYRSHHQQNMHIKMREVKSKTTRSSCREIWKLYSYKYRNSASPIVAGDVGGILSRDPLASPNGKFPMHPPGGTVRVMPPDVLTLSKVLIGIANNIYYDGVV